MERFKRFRFSVPAVPLQKGFFCISVQFKRRGRFRFQFLETVPAVPVPLSVSGKTVPTVPVSGSGSVGNFRPGTSFSENTVSGHATDFFIRRVVLGQETPILKNLQGN